MFPETYEGDLIRMTLQNEVSAHAAGIVEWELVDATPPTPVNPEEVWGNAQTGDIAMWILVALAIIAAATTATVIYRKKFASKLNR